MSTALVTGGAGFIGSHLVRALLARGHEVRVLDDLSTGKRENLDEVRGDITFIEGSITERATVRSAVDGCRWVLHQAALPSVARSVANPAASHHVNVDGSFEVLEASRELGVERLVFAASSSAYGETEVLPKVETMTPMPLSPYAVGKVLLEHYGQVYSRLYDIDCVGLRYFNVFGPRQSPDSAYAAVIPKFIDLMKRGESPTINGDGGHSRDFCYIDNVVSANMLALEAPNAPGHIYNVACGERTTLLELIEAINTILGTDVPARHGPERPGDIRHSLADISAAQRDLGYRVEVPFAAGLERTAAWFADRG